MNVFDRRLVRLHRERAAARLEEHDFLFREVAARLVDRLADTTKRYSQALDLGCHDGVLGRLLAKRDRVDRIVEVDLSHGMVERAGKRSAVADEEMLPFADGSFDLVLSNLSLHWVNDLPGTLIQVLRVLKPDGLFLAAMLGGETLHELRVSLLEAEIELEGGASPRMSPLTDVRDAGGLLQRAGFSLPVVDRDEIMVTYPNALALMHDLRGMGETNAVHARRRGLCRRATMLRAIALYEERFANADGRIPATFQIVYLTGWTPHASQQQPLRPGTARLRLADALESEEIPAGEAATRRKPD